MELTPYADIVIFQPMQMINSRDFGIVARQRRKELGWTQAKLAEQTGVSRDWIVQLEKGKDTAELGLVLRTIKALGLILEAPRERKLPEGSVNLQELLGSSY